ncbi:hypothetical protein HK405_008375, partial [Cladochytrium tenue]
MADAVLASPPLPPPPLPHPASSLASPSSPPTTAAGTSTSSSLPLASTASTTAAHHDASTPASTSASATASLSSPAAAPATDPHNDAASVASSSAATGRFHRCIRLPTNFRIPFAAIITIEIVLCCTLIAVALVVISYVSFKQSTDQCFAQSTQFQEDLVNMIQQAITSLVSDEIDVIVGQPLGAITETSRLHNQSII